ncbi:MAG: hypothetical protein IJX16_03805 [Clostridia bacterium]|nr:hypothetical protein [Clostridia bacterium]
MKVHYKVIRVYPYIRGETNLGDLEYYLNEGYMIERVETLTRSVGNEHHTFNDYILFKLENEKK